MQPFQSYDLRQELYTRSERVKAQVDRISDSDLATKDVEELCRILCDEAKIDPVTIDDTVVPKPKCERRKIEKVINPLMSSDGRNHITVDGIVVSFAYPFTGTGKLFQCRGSTCSLVPYPNISVEGQHVVFKYSFDENDVKQPGWHDKVMAQAKQDVGSIKRGLVPVNSDVEAANHDFVRTIRSAIIAKKSRIDVLNNAINSFA